MSWKALFYTGIVIAVFAIFPQLFLLVALGLIGCLYEFFKERV